jgi:hypothetical protein
MNINTLSKIDEYLERLESELDPRILEDRKEGGKDYDEFFNGVLKKFGVKSYKQLSKDKQKEFFDFVNSHWTSKKEEKNKK